MAVYSPELKEQIVKNMVPRIMGSLLPLTLFVSGSIASVARAHPNPHVHRMANKCETLLVRGVKVTRGKVLPGDLHFYPSWDFTVAAVDRGAELNSGERVWISDKSTHGLTCVATATQAGWMPSQQVAKSSSQASGQATGIPKPDDFVGIWKRGESTTLIIVRMRDGSLSILDGEETCEGVCNQNAYVENMPGKYSGDGVWIFTTPLSPPVSKMYHRLGAEPCEIRIRHLGHVLYVLDNMMCGGLDGSFNGAYHRITAR